MIVDFQYDQVDKVGDGGFLAGNKTFTGATEWTTEETSIDFGEHGCLVGISLGMNNVLEPTQIKFHYNQFDPKAVCVHSHAFGIIMFFGLVFICSGFGIFWWWNSLPFCGKGKPKERNESWKSK